MKRDVHDATHVGERNANAPHVNARRTAKKGRRNLLGILVSVVSVTAVAWWASKQEAPSFPTTPGDLLPLAGGIGVYALLTLGRGWRWHSILRHGAISHPRADAYGLTVVGYMGNTVLPARGGEVLRVLLLYERSDARRREILGTIIAERLLDVATLLVLFLALTWGSVAGAPTGQVSGPIALGCVFSAALAIGVYVRLRMNGRFERFAAAIRPFVRASRLLWGRGGLVLAGASFVIWSLEALNFWLVGRSLDLDIDLLEAAFLVVLTSFVAAVPAAPGYVGTFDAALLFGLDAVGIDGGAALGFVLLVRFVLFVPVTVAGVFLMLTRYGGLGQALGRPRSPG